VAAILGRDVDVVVLRAACPDADMDRFLVECGEARILEGHGYQWRFTHDKLREGLIARVDAAPDPSLYAQAASAVESLHGESPAWTNVLARCWQRAGNIDKAVHHLLLASGQCLRAGATARAVDLGLEAVVLLGVEIPPDPASQGQAVGAGMQRIEELLASRQPADLLELPILDNRAWPASSKSWSK
jgi:hypothetical protein